MRLRKLLFTPLHLPRWAERVRVYPREKRWHMIIGWSMATAFVYEFVWPNDYFPSGAMLVGTLWLVCSQFGANRSLGE